MQTSGWTVALTKPNSEHLALNNLVSQGYDVFSPTITETIIKQGKKIKRESFLFSRYIFVWVRDQWRSINGTKGVVKLLTREERPLFLSAVDALQLEALRAKGSIVVEEKKRFRPGDQVTIGEGPFFGFKGIYVGQSKAEREFVLLKMLGGDVKVEVAASDLA